MLNLPQFLFINGPAGSGKSTLSGLICESHRKVWPESFAEPIRDALRAVFFPEDGVMPGPDRVDFRDAKIKKSNLLHLAGLEMVEECADPLVRQAMIDFSESFMKPRFGQKIFGQLLWKRCEEQRHWYDHFVVDDSGFAPEAEYVISQAGAANCVLIRLHRAGCTFAGDSRSYVTLPIHSIDLHNDGAAQEMLATLQLELGNL